MRNFDTGKRVLSLEAVVKSACLSTVEDGALKMLSRIHDDDIASVAHNDFCFLQLAKSLYNKNGHDSSKHDYICQNQSAWKIPTDHAQKVSNPNFRGCCKTRKFHKCDWGSKRKDLTRIRTNTKLQALHWKMETPLKWHCHDLMAEDKDLIKSFQKLYWAKWSEYISQCVLSTMKYNKQTILELTSQTSWWKCRKSSQITEGGGNSAELF